ncbi:MAG: Ig-like domain-containing protein [Oscillospiraceae bacterium]|nr:Ig-like domain-containing protein [Oscillospiraceae bacterium]
MKKITSLVLSLMLVCCSGNVVSAENSDEKILSDDIINGSEQQTEVTEIQNETEITEISSETEIYEPVTEENTVTELPAVNDNEIKMPETEYVAVEDIVVSEFKDSMYVDETQNISPTVFPSDATDQRFTYSTSNQSVARIDRLGKITAVGGGTCYVSVECGGLTVSYSLRVKIKTESISVKSKYIVLKPGQQFGLEARVSPSGASQVIKYKSQNEDIASADENGIITANDNGSTSIVISNEDYTMSVNVIVNTDGKVNADDSKTNDINDSSIKSQDKLAEKIRNSAEETIVASNVKKISSEVLREMYGTDKKLIIECDGYDIYLNGRDISNAENELFTELDFTETDKGIMLSQSEQYRLPGKISIKLRNSKSDYKYFYMCSNDGKSFRKLNALSGDNTFSINSAGDYLLTTERAESFRINIVWVLGAAGVILVMSVVYIFNKRKYWFW